MRKIISGICTTLGILLIVLLCGIADFELEDSWKLLLIAMVGILLVVIGSILEKPYEYRCKFVSFICSVYLYIASKSNSNSESARLGRKLIKKYRTFGNMNRYLQYKYDMAHHDEFKEKNRYAK